jgi:hypothetical protein
MNAHRSIMNADGSIDKSKIKVIGLSNSKFDIYETRIAAEIKNSSGNSSRSP